MSRNEPGGEHEAVLLSVVALLAAYSGYAAAKWTTEQRVELAASSGARSEASRAELREINFRNFDSSTFEAWFAASTAKNKQAMELAERRFRPQFRSRSGQATRGLAVRIWDR